MSWKDITSYRQGDKERVPRTYTKKFRWLCVTVTRHVFADPDVWYLRADPLGLDMVEVGRGDDPAPAQRQALKVVESRLAELTQDLEEMKDD